MMTNGIESNTGVFRMRQFNPCKKGIFKIPSYQNIAIHFDVFPKNKNGYFVAYFDEVCG